MKSILDYIKVFKNIETYKGPGPRTMKLAGGGMVGIRKPNAIPPEKQGLRSIMINDKDY